MPPLPGSQSGIIERQHLQTTTIVTNLILMESGIAEGIISAGIIIMSPVG